MATTYNAGISIESSVHGGPGTLGCFAKDSKGTPVLLTCSHVLYSGFSAPQHGAVCTPEYSTCCGGDRIATMVVDDTKFDTDGRYIAGFTGTDKSVTDCATAVLDKGIQFTNTLKLTAGDIVIDGAEQDVTTLLGTTLLNVGQAPSADQYVRVVSMNHPGQAIWGTVMWQSPGAGVAAKDIVSLGGKSVTPIEASVLSGTTPAEDATAGSIPSVNEFLVLPRPPPQTGVSDYTKFYNQQWLSSFKQGDSGSVVVNAKNQVVGMVIRIIPFNLTGLVAPGTTPPLEYASTTAIGVCTPIRDIISLLGITIPAAPFTGTGVGIAAPARAALLPFTDPQLAMQRSAMTELRAGLLQHRRGRLLVGKVNEHRRELQRMFVRVRAVVSAWQSLGGPAWYLHCARSLRTPSHTIPTSINGVTRDRLADTLLPLIEAHASAELKRDIVQYGTWARAALLHVPTMRAAIAAVAGAAG